MKKSLLSLLSTVSLLTLLTACGGGGTEEQESVTDTGKTTDTTETASGGSVYYLNFKPEIADAIEDLAEAYTEETGVEVKMVTAAGGTYEQTLKSEITKSAPPTIFFINGPIGYQNWQDYTLDLADTDVYDWLVDKELAITGEDDSVAGIPITVEGYGIIYNAAIMEDYFALENKATNFDSMEDINNFDALKDVVEDMTALKDDLGIEGVFSSTSLASGDQWRWQTHLANLPVYYEYRDADVDAMSEITFKYGKQYQNIFDLYINNSTNAPGLLGAKTTTDSMTEFALGQSAMVQNGNWGWGQISGTEGNVVNEEDVNFMPIYTGVEGEEAQGLAIGTENFMAVNSQASEEDIQASLDFIEWMYSSETGKDYVINQFGFIPTFNTFGEEEFPTDPLAQDVLGSMNDEAKYSVPWTFTTFPSEAFKNDFGNSLLMYAQDQATWDEVESTVVDAWAREAALTQ